MPKRLAISLNGTWSRMCQRRIIPSNATSITPKPLLIIMSRIVFYPWVSLACKLWGEVGQYSVQINRLRISTNAKQDGLITTSAEKSAADHNSGKVEYNLYSNNCMDAAVNVVNSSGSGITVSNPATTVKPNSWIKEVKEDPK